jgi:osmotically-inducible protein OsmY
MAEYWDRERGRRYRGEGYYGGYYGDPERERERDREREYERRSGERGFFDRAGDEVRSWFGDEDAQRRRMRDERENRWGERAGWGSSRGDERERGGGGSRGDDDTDRDWARQWGYVEGRGFPRGWGYSGGYGAGAGFVGGRPQWGQGDTGYEASGWTGRERYGRSSRFGRDAMSGPHVGRGPRGYQRSDDRIREDICERMCDSGELDASDIEVRVSNGEATLLGTVQDRRDKRLAEDLTEQVSGVREVHNQIRVSQPGSDAGQNPQQQQRYRIA